MLSNQPKRAFVKRAVVLSFFVPITIGLFTIFFSSKKRAPPGRIGMYIGTYFRFRKSNQQIAAVQQILLLTQLSKQKQVAFAFMVLLSIVEKKLSPFLGVLFIGYVYVGNVYREHSHMMSDFQVGRQVKLPLILLHRL